MSENFKIGNYEISTEKYYNVLLENNCTSNAQLAKLDANKDNKLTEDELMSLEVSSDETDDETVTQSGTTTGTTNTAATKEEQIEQVKEQYEEQIIAVYEEIEKLEEERRKVNSDMGTAEDLSALDGYISNMENITSQIESLRNQILSLTVTMENQIKNIEASASVVDSSGEYNINTGDGVTGTTNFSYNFTEKLTAQQQSDLSAFKANWEKNKSRYQSVAAKTGVPAELIAAIHWREASGNFNSRLHDGGSLSGYSSWEAAAIDALSGSYGSIDKNDITTWYEFAERYNGLGYRNKGVASPYVWAGTTNYTSGKYVADGVYDAGYVDKQLGVAVMLKAILQ